MIKLDKTQIMSDIVHGSIIYSGIEHAVISTPIFNRLHRISQNSLVFLTFPSNKVKRFEHSVGTMHIAGEIFYDSICNAKEAVIKDFLNKVRDEISAWRTNIRQGDLPKDLKNTKEKVILGMDYPQCALYHQYCPSNLEKEDKLLYFIAFQAVRLAGLLHDVGHLPYSHILEKALKNLYHEVNNLNEDKNEAMTEFMEIMAPFIDGPDEIHEEFGKLLVEKIKQSILEGLSKDQQRDITYFFIVLVFDFAGKILSSQFTDNTIFSDLHLIVSGVVDADRLDYCSRDSFCAALDTDIFFYKRFAHDYTMIKKVIGDDAYEHYFFSPSAKNLNMMHELIRKRYRIFKDINYHHRVHKHEIILEKVICSLGLKELKEMQTVGDLPDVLPMQVSSMWKLVKELKKDNTWMEYQLIQLDDSWLDTLLKHKFFENYGSSYLSIQMHGGDIQWNQFDELISTTKRYYSLVKRPGDFQRIDEAFFHKFCETDWSTLEFQQKVQQLKEEKYTDFLKGQRTFLFNDCINYILMVDDVKDSFYRSVEDAVNNSNVQHVSNCIVRSSRFSHGLNTVKSPVFLMDAEGNEIIFEPLLTLRDEFLREEALSPPFHLYYLPEYDNQDIPYEIDIGDLISNLTSALIKCLQMVENKYAKKEDEQQKS